MSTRILSQVATLIAVVALESAASSCGLMHQDRPLVIVRWQDNGKPLSSWQYLPALPQTHVIECVTVGWLLKDNDDLKVICQSNGEF